MTEIVLLDEHHLNIEELDFNFSAAAIKFFPWDPKKYNAEHFSLKRLVFIYEYLCQTNTSIILANANELLTNLQAQFPEAYLYFSSVVADQVEESTLEVINYRIVHSKTFLTDPGKYHEKFFRYWQVIKGQLN